MKSWIPVTCCPRCGGDLEIDFYYSFSRTYRITKKGKLSNRYRVSPGGALNCMTAFCKGCETVFEDDEIVVEQDGTVYMKEKGR